MVLFIDLCLFLDVEIVDIACGGDHTLAKSKDGKLFASGWNEQ